MLQRKSVWAVSAHFLNWRKNSDVSEEQISVLYVNVVLTDCVWSTKTLCVLIMGANFEDRRQGFHVSQTQTLVCCTVQILCVTHRNSLSPTWITAQAWLPEIDIGEALGV